MSNDESSSSSSSSSSPSSSSSSDEEEGKQCVGSQFFYIVSKLNKMVLDVADHSHEDNAKIIMWPKKAANEPHDNQLWFVDPVTKTVRSKELTELCLDVNEDNDRLVMRHPEPDRSWQHWDFLKKRVCNYDATHKVIDIVGGSMEARAEVCLWDWHGNNNQIFKQKFLQRSHFQILSKLNGKALDAEDGVVGSALVMQEAEAHKDSQSFFIDRNGLIRSKDKQLVLDCSGDDRHLHLNEFDASENKQRWCIRDDCVVNADDTDLVMDIKGGSSEDGAAVLAYAFHGAQNQRWNFEKL
ncbi:hypothetical protein CAPTEDRAFT_193478 [Capitella teleta]|uniref:Ricin B lectin domain-containing protein n=1 Tax=Capitella teleta TaxID=283909 RepID=R7U0E5_CAPTE|nr:hypothetical protein CAPTEDRAFT_193478 [Capitella teleta]|eukprot:ELT97141.1 hypothetical protein CAPTEDRAFT_193478 [Capitella teleta]